jgi:DNA-binding transcriptional LysR family regulator
MNRYEVFVKVVELGSFTRAAAALNYTQSAVSQMVHTLEAELAATLVRRAKGGVGLTADGEAYYPYIRAIARAHRELEEKRREMLGLGGGVLRIGTFTSISRNWLPGLMKRFKQDHPAVQFELFQGEYTNISQWIREGRVDFGFVMPEAAADLEVLPLYDDEMVAVLPEGHPLADREAVSLAAMAGQANILLDEGELSVPLRAYAESGLTPDIQYRVYDDYSILKMVEQHLGVSILYQAVVQGQVHRCAVRRIDPPVRRTVAVAMEDRRMLSIAGRAFLDFILQHFKEKTPSR